MPRQAKYAFIGTFITLTVGGTAYALIPDKPKYQNPTTQTTSKTSTQDVDEKNKIENSTPVTKTQQSVDEPPKLSTKCHDESIPFTTVYKDAIWLPVGETEVRFDKGRDGKVKVCVRSDGYTTREITAPPSERIVYVGTKVETPAEDPTSSYTYDEALSRSKETCRKEGHYADSTDMTQCVNREMDKYGY